MSEVTGLSELKYDGLKSIRLIKWKISTDSRLVNGTLLFNYSECNADGKAVGIEKKYRCNVVGSVIKLLAIENDLIEPNSALLVYQTCMHTTVIKDLCAECGADLRQLNMTDYQRISSAASISMIHSVPELRVSQQHAEQLGKYDELRLLKTRKLVLLVDLDQTLIHTTNNNVPEDMKDVFHFQLGSNSPWYHTKFRPNTESFLESMSKLYELHICTFGARLYAHQITCYLDPSRKYFSHRILSRDECFDPTSKTGNLKGLFPCGDSMVCIIDDREDVWNFTPNMVTVKPYYYFKNTGDINSPYKASDSIYFNHEKMEPSIAESTITDSQKSKTEEDSLTVQKGDEAKTLTESKNSGTDNGSTGDEPMITSENDETTLLNAIDTKNTGEQEKDSEEKLDGEVTIPVKTAEIKKAVEPEKAQKNSATIVIKDGNTPSRHNENDDEDDYLLYLEEILRRIHVAYFNKYDENLKLSSEGERIQLPDLKVIVPNVRRAVLKGLNLVFSGIIPTNTPPEKSKYWILAKSLGANVFENIVLDGSPYERTTHLVADKLRTVKVNLASKSKHIFLVNPEWLFCCAERWERVEEKLYPVRSKDDLVNQSKKMLKLPIQPGLTNVGTERRLDHRDLFPTYDPITGKRMQRKATSDGAVNQKQSNVKVDNNQSVGQTRCEPSNMIDFSPLSAFSQNELRLMGSEVDDFCSEGDEDHDAEEAGHSSNSDGDQSDISENLVDTANSMKRKRESSSEDEIPRD